MFPAQQSGTCLPKTAAVIVAAGLSHRMGGCSKQFLSVAGIPVLARTLLAFDGADTIHEVVVVTKSEDMDAVRALIAAHHIVKPIRIVAGGATRAESAKAGFVAIGKDVDYVAIHDGARCLVTAGMIHNVCHAAYATGAASAATSVVDTVKIADGKGFIATTVDRKTVFLASTPQIFSVPLYKKALLYASADITDDNQLVEALGHPVKLVDCGRENIKITYPADIPYAEFLLKEREKMS